MNEPDRAMSAYESALRHNPYSIPALTQIAALCRAREQYGKVCCPEDPDGFYVPVSYGASQGGGILSKDLEY